MTDRHAPAGPPGIQRVLALLALCALTQPPLALRAEERGGVRASIRMEIVRVESPPGRGSEAVPGDPAANFTAMFEQMGEMFVKMIAPAGKVDMTWMSQEGVARSELKDDMLMMPAGTVMLVREGEVQVLDPGRRTYYVAPGPPASGSPFGAPGGGTLPKADVRVTPTGETTTMLGRTVERVTIDWRLPLPIKDSPQLPPGFPQELEMSIETWEAQMPLSGEGLGLSADVHAFMSAIGMSEIIRPGRFPLKTVMRGSMFPGFELRTTVLELEEGVFPGELFVVPEGYTRVDPPARPAPGGLRQGP